MALSPGACPAPRPPGFTLIELLVCVSIIALLLGLMLPCLGRARERGRASACLTRLRGLQVATYVYADAYRAPPVTVDLSNVLEVLELPKTAWACPSDRAWAGGSSYTYLAPMYMLDPPGIPLSLTTLKPWLAMRVYERNVYVPLYWDADTRHENDCNVVYWDGRAQRRNW
jgi:prepilin-type N-terminal cleavage/methylation domain-containing protein/prepilin-type processing-associated H-X9-DG protein